jgi:hypothetical protein
MSEVKPACECDTPKSSQIQIKESSSDVVSKQSVAYTQYDDSSTLVGGVYKKFFEITFLNKKHIIHSHNEEDAIIIFLKNKIFKRDNLLKIKQIETVSNNKSKKNITFKNKNYQIYIVRGFRKSIFFKI